MNTKSLKAWSVVVALLSCVVVVAQEEPIDFKKAREIMERSRRGGDVSAEDQAYLQRARKAREEGRGKKRPGSARNALPEAPAPWTGSLTPLTELGTAAYKGEQGGLYGAGSNVPPANHLRAAMSESAKIRPLDATGEPSNAGKIGFLSVGMSNTTQEFNRFMALARDDSAKSAPVVLVDGAQGGQTASRWADSAAPLWPKVDERVTAAGLSPQQIQVIWMKQAEAGPARQGEFPKHAQIMKENLVTVLGHLKQRFPNLRIVYVSSRIYAGYARTPLNPEPYAYETAFALRWLIADQIAGRPALNWDSSRGPVKSPLILWGPYLWADGEKPRKDDGLFYRRDDLANDGTHPSDSGREKVAKLLLKFLETDPTARSWFTGK